MNYPVFPIFTIAVKGDRVIAAGGGGDPDFGKRNGVLILDLTTYNDLGYYETPDLISDIYVYETDDVDSESLEEADSKEMEEDGIKNKSSNQEITAFKEISNRKKYQPKKRKYQNQEKNKDKPNSQLYVSAISNDYLYLLRINNDKFTLLQKIKKKVSFQMFTSKFFFISNQQLYGFDRIHKTPELLDTITELDPKDDQQTDTHQEEYFYTLYKNEGLIIPQREEGTRDIFNNWESFFIISNRIHKVVFEYGLYTFVFNNKKYQYSEVPRSIRFNPFNQTIVFFLKGYEQSLHIITWLGEEYIHKIPMITCLNTEGEVTVVGTGEGKVYIYKEPCYGSAMTVADVPITGVALYKGYVYFTSFNGLIDRKKVNYRLYVFSFILLVGIICGIIAYYWKLKYDTLYK
ncbi:hypothetical protein TCON_0833 [Astathelohania contejeani]|uniref:Uncharacterized protein n=1 Tax=Astathelohania contejeani TaxID=164912 RepID=A0ABQ7I0M7_9MICR|nr:hypothetical protein TCON_0833 [Thelohania contejeani]